MTYKEAKEELARAYCQFDRYCPYRKGIDCDTICSYGKAIEALEKQIPKKVGKRDIVSYGSPYYCPECEAELIPVEFFKADGSEPEEKVSYCWKCGRAIDWSSEDGR